MNKAELFSKSSRIVERNLGDPDAPLHGILPIEEYTGLSVVAIPYAGTALKVQVLEAGSRRIDQEFKMGLHQILDLVRHLVRSLQLLGPSIDRFMKYVDWGREPGSFTIETDDLYNFMHKDIDVVIFIDLSILYLRIIGDCIGRTLPSLLGDLPRRGLKKGSLREVWNYAKKEPQTPLGELFSTTSMESFEILARHVQPGSGSRGHPGCAVSSWSDDDTRRPQKST